MKMIEQIITMVINIEFNITALATDFQSCQETCDGLTPIREFWTKNPGHFPECIIIIFKNIFLEIESASFLDKRTTMCSVFFVRK